VLVPARRRHSGLLYRPPVLLCLLVVSSTSGQRSSSSGFPLEVSRFPPIQSRTSRLFPRVRPCSDLRCPEVPESWLPWACFALLSPHQSGLQTLPRAVLLLVPVACEGFKRSDVHVLWKTFGWSEPSRTQLPPSGGRPSHKGSVGSRLVPSSLPLRAGVLFLLRRFASPLRVRRSPLSVETHLPKKGRRFAYGVGQTVCLSPGTSRYLARMIISWGRSRLGCIHGSWSGLLSVPPVSSPQLHSAMTRPAASLAHLNSTSMSVTSASSIPHLSAPASWCGAVDAGERLPSRKTKRWCSTSKNRWVAHPFG